MKKTKYINEEDTRPTFDIKIMAEQGLVGRCFAILADDPGRLQFQGIVRAKLRDDLYLVQYFSAFDGLPTTMQVIGTNVFTSAPDEMRRPHAWIFFEDDEALRYWLEYGSGQYLLRRGKGGDRHAAQKGKQQEDDLEEHSGDA